MSELILGDLTYKNVELSGISQENFNKAKLSLSCMLLTIAWALLQIFDKPIYNRYR